eukprot:11948113-Heterocapsa_arctica.AAC.1
MQGATVVVVIGSLGEYLEGVDDQGRTLSAQGVTLIREAARHGSLDRQFCRPQVMAEMERQTPVPAPGLDPPVERESLQDSLQRL